MRRPDLKPQLDALPAKPGVYRFLAVDEEVLYVGKAVDLRSRVRSYFHDSACHSPKTERLIERTAAIDWIVTPSELEALLLEMNLIKAHRPHFNVVLKDDKRYPYIKVTWSDSFPKVLATRRIEEDGSRYFGPYVSAGAMHDTLHSLRRVFPYRDCDRTIHGQDRRPCLYYHLGLCLGPCIGAVSEEGYRAMIADLCRFLQGHSRKIVAQMRQQMERHATALEFEQAAKLRDRLAAIDKVIARQRVIAPTLVDRDVIALARDDGSAIAEVLFVRGGRLLGREHFRLAGAEESSDRDVLASFLTQFYDEATPIPGEIVVPESPAEAETIERWLASRRGTRVRITVPRRGAKRDMLRVAMENATEALRALKAAYGLEHAGRAVVALTELRDLLGLPQLPQRIECYDISNLQGSDTVGAMVVFERGQPCRADYRHFRVRSAPPGDDYAAMAEVLERRFQRLVHHREALAEASCASGIPGSFDKAPDLVVLDGGKGQLAVARRVLQPLGLDEIPLLALAKRNENLYRPGEPGPIVLARDSDALQLVQRLRDEAHRFAIAYHRKLRGQGSLRSSLDAIPGIGPRRRRALLAHFGSLERIRGASVEELASVPGMNRRIAEQLKAAL